MHQYITVFQKFTAIHVKCLSFLRLYLLSFPLASLYIWCKIPIIFVFFSSQCDAARTRQGFSGWRAHTEHDAYPYNCIKANLVGARSSAQLPVLLLVVFFIRCKVPVLSFKTSLLYFRRNMFLKLVQNWLITSKMLFNVWAFVCFSFLLCRLGLSLSYIPFPPTILSEVIYVKSNRWRIFR